MYDEDQGRGYRVLVDRLWPRGVSKEKAAIDEWAKDVAPSDGLRRWYGHEPDKFARVRPPVLRRAGSLARQGSRCPPTGGLEEAVRGIGDSDA